eukprot:gene26410-17509_t
MDLDAEQNYTDEAQGICPAFSSANSRLHSPKTWTELLEVAEVCNSIQNNTIGSEMTIIDLGGQTITSGFGTKTDIKILGHNIVLRNGVLHLPGLNGARLIVRGNNVRLECLVVMGNGRQEIRDVDELECGLVWIDGGQDVKLIRCSIVGGGDHHVSALCLSAGATAKLFQCICRYAAKDSGLVVVGKGTNVDAVDCAFENNCDGSLRVEIPARARANRCSFGDHTCNCEMANGPPGDNTAHHPCTCGMSNAFPKDRTALVHSTASSLDYFEVGPGQYIPCQLSSEVGLGQYNPDQLNSEDGPGQYNPDQLNSEVGTGQYNPYQLMTLRNKEALAVEKSVAIHDDHCYIDGSNKDTVELQNCTITIASPATFRQRQPCSGRDSPEIKEESDGIPDACCYIGGANEAMSGPKNFTMKGSPGPAVPLGWLLPLS